MTDNIQIAAASRTVLGKANRRLGPDQLAAVIYGAGVKAATPVALDRHAFELALQHEENIASRLMEVTIDGGKPINVIAKSVQRDPMKGGVLHVDLWAVNMRQAVQTTVPVHFEGEAPGVKTGGVMMHNLMTVTIEALPDNLPEALVADVSAIEVGDSIHVRDLIAPEGVTVIDDPDEIVASVVPPQKEEEAVAPEAAEPELIGAKPEEEE